MKKLLFVALLLPALALAAESPFTGTWKIDLGKIQFAAPPQSWVLQNGRYQCSTCNPKVDIKADGTDQPTPDSKYYDTQAVRIVDDKTVEMTHKKLGKVIANEKFVVSPDGKTMSLEFTEYPEGSQKPIVGKETIARVAAGPAGSHAISGSWRMTKVDSASENALLVTYKCSAEGLTMSMRTGQSYDAKFDGKDYPVKGDPGGSMVSVKMVTDHSIEETTKRDGKVVAVNYMTVSADGKTLTVKSENKEQGGSVTFVAVKQ